MVGWFYGCVVYVGRIRRKNVYGGDSDASADVSVKTSVREQLLFFNFDHKHM